MHGRGRQCLLRGHPHSAEDDDDHGEDEEHAARHVDEDVGVVVLFFRAHCFEEEEEEEVKANRKSLRMQINIKMISLMLFIVIY